LRAAGRHRQFPWTCCGPRATTARRSLF